MSSAGEQFETDSTDSWSKIAKHRDLLEEIVEEDGPFAPEARELLRALNERGERR